MYHLAVLRDVRRWYGRVLGGRTFSRFFHSVPRTVSGCGTPIREIERPPAHGVDVKCLTVRTWRHSGRGPDVALR